MPRYNNPPSQVKDWVALGDSYSAGPGAGAEWDKPGGSGDCMRRDHVYAPALQKDEDMIDPEGPRLGHPTFRFASCTGHTTTNLLDYTDPNENQLNKIQSDTAFATLSIGGNDVLFAPVLKACVFGATLHGQKKRCDERRAEAIGELLSTEFHKRYNRILTQIINEKFRWSKDSHDTSVLYQTSYIQFFDDWTPQCDDTTFLPFNPKAPKMKTDLRRSLNFMLHQLNEVLQYWIDLRNDEGAKFVNKDGEMQMFVSPVHWVDVDWRYKDHRFCRDRVEEPNRDTADTWFFHVPKIPLKQGQGNNQTYLDDVMEFYPLTWQPGQPGEPGFNASVAPDSEERPFYPTDPVHLLANEKMVRTFHPKPDGFAAEAEGLKFELYRRNVR